MGKVSVSAFTIVIGALLAAGSVVADCRIETLAELPVTMSDLRPHVPAKVNGTEVEFLADSGAFYSVISPSSAKRLGLALKAMPGARIVGVNGSAAISLATVKTFTWVDQTIPNVEFIVGGTNVDTGLVGVLGQNIWSLWDVEYDLANGVIRLMRPFDCKGRMLAYWAGDKPYSAMDINIANEGGQHTIGIAYVNGAKIRATFDTGAGWSVLTLPAARRAGVNFKDPAVVDGGFSGGFGSEIVRNWIVPVGGFKVGDEQILHTRLRVGDFPTMSTDMLIGADFFLSHRIYVANSQHRMYFTYNGGPVFNLESTPQGQASTAAQSGSDIPKDADGYARRAAALASRRAYGSAIADFSEAIKRAPTNATYLSDRAAAYISDHQPTLAMSDYDRVLTLKPADVSTLVARARLRLTAKDKSGAAADLDLADRSAPKDADSRLEVAELYERVDRVASALSQFDAWIGVNPKNPRMALALNGRCWERALLGQDLDKAMADCDAALKLVPGSANILDSRGLVHLSLGHFDLAIADYDAALKQNPAIAWSLYGRGIARLRVGQTAAGKADIAAAAVLQPDLPADAAKFRITP